ncbi:MAG: hypothetical protein KatS3mg077_3193 [Candidatus Binatia bacterium]|nr:MAG: hypothetical protein KatS3mg077_3193 [Candidatus Binatia bacterium]
MDQRQGTRARKVPRIARQQVNICPSSVRGCHGEFRSRTPAVARKPGRADGAGAVRKDLARRALPVTLLAGAIFAVMASVPARLRAQVVLSLLGEDVIITHLDRGESQRVRVGDGVQKALAVVANGAHAYVLVGEDAEVGGSEIARIDWRSARERERLRVPCCASVLAVTEDDRWLAAGGEGPERGRVYVFDLGTASRAARTIEVSGRVVREILADGARFVAASGEPLRLPLLTRMFVTMIDSAAVVAEDEIAGGLSLRWSYVASRQVVVWTDESDNLVITHLGGLGRHLVDIQPRFGDLRGALANSASAYASFFPSGKVIRVDLQSAQQVDFDMFMVAGEFLVAVTQDDHQLLTIWVEPERGFMLRSYRIPPPGGSPLLRGQASWQEGLPLDTRIVGSQVVVASVEASPVPDEFVLSIWDLVPEEGSIDFVGEYRILGRLPLGRIVEPQGFVYLGLTPQSSATPSPTPTPRGAGDDGCRVRATSSSGLPWLGLAVLLFAAWRRRRVSLVAIVLMLATAAPATARVIDGGATMRIDLGPIQPAPQPTGPAAARPVAPGSGGGGSSSIEHDQMNLAESFESLSAPAVTYEVDIALDVQSNWRGWFDDDVQLLINYLAGAFELSNGVLLRDAGVKVTIVHTHVWRNRDRRDRPDPDIRNALAVLRFDGGNGGHGTRGGYVQNEPLRLGDLGSLERSFSRRPLCNERG